MAKFKPGDNVIISKDSKNVWIRGKKGTIIRFLEEDNVPGSLYQWTYEVKLEDGDKSYVPQWEMVLEEGAKHHCIFEITQPNIHSELYKAFILRCLEQEEFDVVQEYLKTNPHGDVSEVYSPFLSTITI